MNDLIPIDLEQVKSQEIFAPNGMKPIIDKIADEVRKEVFDVTTETGRKRIASVAHQIARSKTFLDDKGKDMVEDWKKQSKIVDAERKYARDALEALKEEIRKPLTDWEQAEEDRVTRMKSIIEKAISHGKEASELWASLTVIQMLQYKNYIDNTYDGVKWEEFEDWATESYREAMAQLDTAIARREKYDAEQAELVELRRLKEENERKDRERQIAEAAAARARADAEAEAERAAQRAKDAADSALHQEQERAAHARRQEEAAARAAQERVEAAEKEARAADLRAEQARQRAETEALEAVERERQRVADAEKKAADEQAAREADRAHRAKINNAALIAITEIIENTQDQASATNTAKSIVEAIASTRIPHIKINY